MGIEDKVDHKKPFNVVEKKEWGIDDKTSQCMHHLKRAGDIIRPFLHEYLGCAVVFFYRHGPDAHVMQTFADVSKVPELLGQGGAQAVTEKLMSCYGHKIPEKRK